MMYIYQQLQFEYLEQIEYTPIEITDDMLDIAQQIIDMGTGKKIAESIM